MPYNLNMRFFSAFLIVCPAVLAQKPPFDVHAMMRLARISEHQLSPDGAKVAFTVQ